MDLEQTGKLFPDFTDPREAANMQIIKYDEATGSLHPFQVARVNGVWSIPSHHNYPADAKEHLAQAATALMGLEILGVAGNKPGEHELFGVLDPDPQSVGPGSVGIGTRVTMKDFKDNVLADLIIGKEVKDKPQLRYVRKAGRDQVYTVAIQTDKLSTKFGDWIEKDLLKLNPIDIRSIQLNDYSVVSEFTLEGQQLGRDLHGTLLLDYDEAKNAWTLAKAIEYVDGKKPVANDLKEGEELNSEKLGALKTALDDLQIVDVEQKPPGMKQLSISAEVPRDQLRTQLESLFKRGYYPVQDRDGGMSLLSSEGEAIVSMKDGVQYVLRFGSVASTDDEKEKEASKDATGKKAPGSRLNRYLFVMAQFDPALIPVPTLEEVPEGDKAGDEKKEDDKKESDDSATADSKAAADDKAPADEDKKPADDKQPEAKADDADSKSKQAKEEDEAERKKKLEDERAAIERRNKQKEDKYKEEVKKGEEHVSELNDRFAGWYYIISDDVYHKIHLSRADVVKKKEEKKDDKDAKPGQGDTPAALQEIEKKGLGK